MRTSRRSHSPALRTALRLLAGAWLASLVLAGPAVAEQRPPPQSLVIDASLKLVESLRENLDSIKSDEEVGFRLASDTVLPHLDFEKISRVVLGRHYRQATEAQRAQFAEAFKRMLMRTYVTVMVEYADAIVSHADDVTFPPPRYQPGKPDAEVPMRIRLDDGATVEVRYRLHETADMWKIYDVKIEGVSLATTYRSTFSSIIGQRGLDGLITDIVAKNAQPL